MEKKKRGWSLTQSFKKLVNGKLLMGRHLLYSNIPDMVSSAAAHPHVSWAQYGTEVVHLRS